MPLDEIVSGGPPKDGIPAIDRPRYVPVAEARAWLRDEEPVLVVEGGSVIRAYPYQVLIWHEIVNDDVAALPLAVTYCPLCNTALVFRREHGGRILDFGTTGRVRHSDLVMYDRQTESWWQQATGEAIVGELAGERLEAYPARTASWREFRESQVRKLERQNARLENELRKAHLIIDVQGKVAGLLGISLDDGTNS